MNWESGNTLLKVTSITLKWIGNLATAIHHWNDVDMSYSHSYRDLQIKSNVYSHSAWSWCLASENRRRMVREVSQGMIGTRVIAVIWPPLANKVLNSFFLFASVGGYWKIRSTACWVGYRSIYGLDKCLKLCTADAKCKAIVYRHLGANKSPNKCILKSVAELCASPGYVGLRSNSDYYIKIWMTSFPLDPP